MTALLRFLYSLRFKKILRSLLHVIKADIIFQTNAAYNGNILAIAHVPFSQSLDTLTLDTSHTERKSIEVGATTEFKELHSSSATRKHLNSSNSNIEDFPTVHKNLQARSRVHTDGKRSLP